jgi:hypothetical protein
MGTALCGAERRRRAGGRSRVEHVEDRTVVPVCQASPEREKEDYSEGGRHK